MDEFLSKAAMTGASFVGRAAWSYAASIALKRFSDGLKEDVAQEPTEVMKQLIKLDKKLTRKLLVVNPIIDSLELQVAQGRTDLDHILQLTDEFKQSVEKLSISVHRQSPTENLNQMKDIVEDIDDLIPLLQLVPRAPQRASADTKLSVSRLLQASAAMRKRLHGAGEVDCQFTVRLYSLFQGSARKNAVDGTWKEDYSKCTVTLKREHQFSYTLVLTENFGDGRVHDEPPRHRAINVPVIEKMFYTCSGTLLNIKEATLPVLVLKVVQSSVEWLALELYHDKDNFSDESSDEDYDELGILPLETDIPEHECDNSPNYQTVGDVRNSEDQSDSIDLNLELNKGKLELANGITNIGLNNEDGDARRESVDSIPGLNIRKIKLNNEKMNLGQLCYLEYMLRLAIIENRLEKSHLSISDDTLLQYFTNTVAQEHMEPTQPSYRGIQATPTRPKAKQLIAG